MTRRALPCLVLLLFGASLLVADGRITPPAVAATEKCTTSADTNPCAIDCVPNREFVVSDDIVGPLKVGTSPNGALYCPYQGGTGTWDSGEECLGKNPCYGTTPNNIAKGPGECKRTIGNATPQVTCRVDADRRSGVLDFSCAFTAIRDVTDEEGQQTWVELTYSYFAGMPDVSQFEITCWLQTAATAGVGEIAGTRHTCSGSWSTGACANPTIFEIDATDSVYACTHLSYTDHGSRPPGPDQALELVDHALEDLFWTGGVTTLGGAADLFDGVAAAVEGVLVTLLDSDPTGALPEPDQRYHTETLDDDPDITGDQCSPVVSM